MSGRLLRPAAWLYAVGLILLTLGPAGVRPETAMPHYLEHLAAFGISGLLFVAGYRDRGVLLIFFGAAFAASLEVLQVWAPGRHARITDLATDASGFWIGVAVGLIILRWFVDSRRSRESAG